MVLKSVEKPLPLGVCPNISSVGGFHLHLFIKPLGFLLEEEKTQGKEFLFKEFWDVWENLEKSCPLRRFGEPLLLWGCRGEIQPHFFGAFENFCGAPIRECLLGAHRKFGCRTKKVVVLAENIGVYNGEVFL